MGQKNVKLAAKIGFHVLFWIPFREGAFRIYFWFLWLFWKKEDLEKIQSKLGTFLGFLLTTLVIRFYWTDWALVDGLNSIQFSFRWFCFVHQAKHSKLPFWQIWWQIHSANSLLFQYCVILTFFLYPYTTIY